MKDHPDGTRIDKWLWAARFFKTRSNAAEAVAGGKVHLNEARIKPAKTVSIGDKLRIRRGDFEFTVVVRAISNQRRQASEAQQLYEELEESIQRRAAIAADRRAARALGLHRAKRPDKKSRRDLLRIKKGQG
jgi:ribosome-associated heat shock protein Hsp15